MIDFNRGLVIHGFLKTLLYFLETLHMGACLLSTTKKVCAKFLNHYQVVHPCSSTMVWFKVCWRSNKKFSGQKHFISVNWLFLEIFLAFGFICFAIAKIGRWSDISYIGVPDNISCLHDAEQSHVNEVLRSSHVSYVVGQWSWSDKA